MCTWFYTYIWFIGLYNIFCAYIILLNVIFTSLYETYSNVIVAFFIRTFGEHAHIATVSVHVFIPTLRLPPFLFQNTKHLHIDVFMGADPFLFLSDRLNLRIFFLSDAYINVHLGNMSVEN